MFISLFNLNVTGIQVGPTIQGALFSTDTAAKHVKPQNLSVPYLDPQSNPSLLSLLGWHTATSEFSGRNSEIAELFDWCETEPKISIKLVSGVGGAGKSRLAAEFAKRVKKKNWEAGFLDLKIERGILIGDVGNLVVIDYPEESIEELQNFVGQIVAAYDELPRLRILLLSRQPSDQWISVFSHGKADALFDIADINLKGLDGSEGYRIFSSAQESIATRLETVPHPVSIQEFSEWFSSSADNQRPLFIVAAAAHSAVFEKSLTITFEADSIISEIIQREIVRLTGIEKQNDLPEGTLKFAVACAAINGSERLEKVTKLLNEIGVGPMVQSSVLHDALKSAGYADGENVVQIGPDIIAACLAIKVFKNKFRKIPNYLLESAVQLGPSSLHRVARLTYDGRILDGQGSFFFSDWLAQGVRKDLQAATAMSPFFLSSSYPWALMPVDEAVWDCLSKNTTDPIQKSFFVNNLAAVLIQRDKFSEARAELERAIELKKEISHEDHPELVPEWAINFFNLSRIQVNEGEFSNARQSLDESIRLFEKTTSGLTIDKAATYAGAMNFRSRIKSADGDSTGALVDAEKAVGITKQIFEVNEDFIAGDYFYRRIDLALCRMKAGDYSDAKRELDDLEAEVMGKYEQRPEEFGHVLSGVYHNRGIIYAKDRRFEDAYNNFETALNFSKKTVGMNNYLTSTYEVSLYLRTVMLLILEDPGAIEAAQEWVEFVSIYPDRVNQPETAIIMAISLYAGATARLHGDQKCKELVVALTEKYALMPEHDSGDVAVEALKHYRSIEHTLENFDLESAPSDIFM